MFHPRRTYRHEACLDVDLYILGHAGVYDNGTSLIVRYINRRTQDFLGQELVFIKRENYHQWRELSLD